MQVLDDQHHDALGAQRVQQRQQRLEQAPLRDAHVLGAGARAGQAEAGKQAVQLGARGLGERVERGVAVACQWPQCGDDRRVGQLALPELDAVAREEAAARRAGAAGGLVEDPGLPEPRLTRYEDERRAPRGRV